MWPDNETDRDFLNFTGVADTIAEIVIQANKRPISIGVSGAWGVGKSSMIKMVEQSLSSRPTPPEDQDFVFVTFNAWLYQGYDDARAALMDVIASKLEQEAKDREKGIDKAQKFLARVNWARLAKLTAGSAGYLALGLPPVGLIGEAWNLTKEVLENGADEETIKRGKRIVDGAGNSFDGLINPANQPSPPKEIQELRDSFEDVLDELGITLVVLIDDLDRCLPETTISTLEAVRLFLFLKNTAFVVAADTDMIKHAVRKHFSGTPDDSFVTNYFDKLIQIPIRVPPLGTQEVRAYMMLLFIDNSELPEDEKEQLRSKICSQLKKTWQGARVDKSFVQEQLKSPPANLINKLDVADRLAPLMSTASGISGNPRLIKRFLNALSIRMSISAAHGVGVDEAVLAKLMLFERLSTPQAYSELAASVNSSDEGKPTKISEWEEDAIKGKEIDLPKNWDSPFVIEWLQLPPQLAQLDLRGALYVSREHAPIITPQDRMSSDGAELLKALLEHPEGASSLEGGLRTISPQERAVIMDKLLESARKTQEWGVPAILTACLSLGRVDPNQEARLIAFLSDIPHTSIRPNLIPKISGEQWAKKLYKIWAEGDTSPPVKSAIEQRMAD